MSNTFSHDTLKNLIATFRRCKRLMDAGRPYFPKNAHPRGVFAAACKNCLLPHTEHSQLENVLKCPFAPTMYEAFTESEVDELYCAWTYEGIAINDIPELNG